MIAFFADFRKADKGPSFHSAAPNAVKIWLRRRRAGPYKNQQPAICVSAFEY